ncbi:uncharacterized protein RAG0_16134 [Rhynchosporium agropyri]|uniref:Uncharacterized protein n=1 Tax=Rhynchosporium agropyri TaxID=914238 RepID=A0A1E1LQU1_9HELO|nr:uncharacterized protein RAG0_16134 [Rhynchosporium agropyri]
MEPRTKLGFLVSTRYGIPDFFDVPQSTIITTPSHPLPSASPSSSSSLSTLPNNIMESSLCSAKQQIISRSSGSGPNILTIPLEIRLHIYNYVLMSHPIHHPHLAPSNPRPKFSSLNTVDFHTTMKRANSPPFPTEKITYTLITSPARQTSTQSPLELVSELKSKSEIPAAYIETLLPGRRQRTKIQGKISTALLSTCKQIYAETANMPWHANTFSFVNWFCSGVYAARAFMKGLEPWQQREMRCVSIEVLGKDLWGRMGGIEREERMSVLAGSEENGLGEWRELCTLWSGVRDLKMVIKGSLSHDALSVSAPGLSSSTTISGPSETPAHSNRGSILTENFHWIAHGLLALTGLRTVELEIEDVDTSREIKMEFCAALERTLNFEERKEGRLDEQGWAGDKGVVLVERKMILRDEKDDKFVYYGGEPGDEEVWREG